MKLTYRAGFTRILVRKCNEAVQGRRRHNARRHPTADLTHPTLFLSLVPWRIQTPACPAQYKFLSADTFCRRNTGPDPLLTHSPLAGSLRICNPPFLLLSSFCSIPPSIRRHHNIARPHIERALYTCPHALQCTPQLQPLRLFFPFV